MDIAQELQEAKAKQAEIVRKINALDQERQQRVQEALKLEGEIRLLIRLNKSE